jgi:hypothetical protein
MRLQTSRWLFLTCVSASGLGNAKEKGFHTAALTSKFQNRYRSLEEEISSLETSR